MAASVKKAGYFYVTTADKAGEGARILGALRDSGVNLIAFHAFPTGGGQAQLDFVPADEKAFQDAAKKAGLKVSGKKTVFLAEDDDRRGSVAELLQKLGSAGANVTAIDAVKSGSRYGALIWVKESDVDKAAKALDGGTGAWSGGSKRTATSLMPRERSCTIPLPSGVTRRAATM